MNRELEKTIRKHLKESYRASLPIQYLGRLEDELSVVRGSEFLDDIELIVFLKEAAKKAGYEIDEMTNYGTSLIKSLMGASMVDPLPPYYYCRTCGKMEFVSSALDGFDLPERKCCGKKMVRSGHSIPFEHYRFHAVDQQLGLSFRTATAFVSEAAMLIQEYCDDNTAYHAVQFKSAVDEGEEFDETELALVPQTEPMPETDEDGIWYVDKSEVYFMPGYRFITIAPSGRKDQIAKGLSITGKTPETEDLLAKPVLEAAKKEILERFEGNARAIPAGRELSFYSLLEHAAFARCTYTDENPAFENADFKYSDIFLWRESVWDMITEHIKPEYKIGFGFANKITRYTRSGQFTHGRMAEGIKQVLRSLGIEEHWITQMQHTCYLPAKVDVINTLTDELKLAWYGMHKE